MKQSNDNLVKLYLNARKMQRKLRKDLRIATEALEFYENLDNYKKDSGSISCYRPRGLSRMLYKVLDFGETARDALVRLKEIK